VAGISDADMLSAFIKQYYSLQIVPPPEIHLPIHVEDSNVITKWLLNEKSAKAILKIPKRKSIINMAKRNAESYLHQITAEDGTKGERLTVPQSINDIKTALSLDHLPNRIDAFDISEISGKDSVGSMIVFENGQPKKSEYRRYKIKSVSGQNDYAMLSEVATRRYHRALIEGKVLPDLVVIDGGRGQLSAVLESMRKLKIKNIPVISIAKRLEQVYTAGSGNPIDLPLNSPALKLLQRIRDEAHRFALSYHRKLRGKRLKSSQLMEIPGIGKKRTRQLLTHFGSIEAIKKASTDELSKINGLDKKTVANLRKWASLNGIN
jgi:excinuclease ABC subunit C